MVGLPLFLPYGKNNGELSMTVKSQQAAPSFGKIRNVRELGVLIRTYRKSHQLTLEKVSGLTNISESIEFLMENEIYPFS